MRILFISAATGGGSTRSTFELAELLAPRGHDIAILSRTSGSARRRRLHKRVVNLRTKLGESATASAVGRVGQRIGRKPTRATGTSLEVWETPLPENSLEPLRRRFQPDVVVVSSMGVTAWRQVRAELAAVGIPSVLYIREERGLLHLSLSHAPADLLLTNAHALTEECAALGYEAETVPSIVMLDSSRVESTRERVVYINPVPIQGVDIALALAEARPDVPFLFQEWWPLPDDARRNIEDRLRALPHAELRPPVTDPSVLYADASVLLAPFRFNGRSRLVLEAQSNGIPVLGSDRPAVAESIGPGGVLVGIDEPVDAWAAGLSELIDDPERYLAYSAAAREHAERPEVDPGFLVERFERLICELVANGRAPDAGAAPSRRGPRD
ncbi:MAG: glycosyltransferase [Acidimicrobiia bacterium]